MNDSIPVQPEASSGNSDAFTGTIAALRQLGAKSGLHVTIPEAVVTSISGNGKTVYMSDPAGGAYSGILIAVCNSKSGLCVTSPTTIGATYAITGTFLVTTDGAHMSIGDPTLKPAGGAPVAVPSYLVNPSGVNEAATENADARGVYVSLALNGAVAQVSNATAASFVNTNYSADMEAACRGTTGSADTTQCCPKGVGPKYFGFEVTVGGEVIGISTGNYPSNANSQAGANLIVWPCDGDFSTVLTTATSFSALGGIFDVNYGTGSLSPAVAADATLAK